MSLGNENIHQQGNVPEIIKLPNNRIRVIRRFQKFTREDVDNANLGSLLGDFGALDTDGEQIVNQGYTNCRLISVEVDNRFEKQTNADNPVLVKTYETLTETFVEITSDTEEVGQNNLKQITKVYRAISGTTNDGVIGTTLLNPEAETPDGIILASSKVEDNTAFAELTEVYVETGVLSISESHRYGDKVEVYSVEGINITEAQAKTAITGLPADAKSYGKRISNFLGLETNVFEFFTGSGVISTNVSDSYNSKLTRTTIVSIDVEPVTPTGAVLIESKSETRDEFILYTYTFVKGVGIISTETSNKYESTLDVVTVTSINEPPSVPSGSYTKESLVREESGYLLYSTTYVSGAGEIGRSTDSKYNGTLVLTSVTSINDVPAEDAVLINSSVQSGDYGTVYTYTFASGEGEIGSSVNNKYDGKLTLTTKTSLNVVPSENGALINSSVQDTDFGQIYTYTYAEGQGEIGSSTDNKYNGALTLTTKTSLNVAPNESGAIVSQSVQNTDFGQIYTYTFAVGEGQIGSNIEDKYDGKLTLTTVTSLNEVPNGDGALIRQSSNETDYGTVYTYTYAEGEGEIGSSTENKYNGKLIITTKTSLNTAPDENGAVIRQSVQDTDYGQIYTYTFADGEGEIGSNEEKKYNDQLTITTKTSLNQVPSESGALIRQSVQDTDYGPIYTYTYAVGEGEIGSSTEDKYNGKLTLITKTSLNVVPDESGALIRFNSSETDYGTVYTYTFAEGEGEIGSSEEKKYNDKLSIITKTSLNVVPDEDGALIRSDIQDTDSGQIYTYTFASGEGEIGSNVESKYNDKLILTTKTSLNEIPNEDGVLIRSDIQNTDYGVVYRYTFAQGSGEIGSNIEKKYNDKLTITTKTSLEEIPSEDGALIRQSSQESDYGTIYTYTFANGSGEISRSTEKKYDEKLILTTVTSLDEVPDETGALIKSNVQDTDFGIIYTYTFADGKGEISRLEEKKYDDTLTLLTITSLNEIPSEDGALIRSNIQENDYGIIYTYTFAQGKGEIGSSEEKKYNDKLTITTKTSLNEIPNESGALIQANSSSNDYGIVYTYVYAVGEGEIASSEEKKYDDTLTITTKTSLNEVPDETGALIKSNVQDTDFGQIYTYTFASGEGEIGSNIDKKYNDKLTLTTKTSLNVVPVGDGALIRADASNTDYGIVYTYTFAVGEGQIGISTNYKYDNQLTVKTITSLNIVPNDDNSSLINHESKETDYGTVYTYTFALGVGEIGRSTNYKYNEKLTLTTVTSLNLIPEENGALVNSSIQSTDYGQIHTYTYAEGSGEIGRSVDKKYDEKLTLTTITSLDEVPDEDGALIRSNTQETDYGTIYTYTYADGEGEIGSSVQKKYNDALTITTKTSLNIAPSESGSLIRSDIQENDYGTIYTYIYAEGSGEIGRSTETKYDGQLTLTTVTSLDEVPDEDGYNFKTNSVDSDYGTIYTYGFATGEGKIGEVSSSRYNDKLLIKSETYLNETTDAPSGYTLINTDSKDGEFGVITTYTFAKGDGIISTNQEDRNDGSRIETFVVLGDTKPTAPSGHHLMETSYQAQDGYDVYTYYYYKTPDNYDVDISTQWNKPSNLSWDRSQGFYISSVGSLESVTGKSTVTFTTTPATAVPLADLSVGAVARESVKYADGTRLVRSTTFTNTFHNGAGSTVQNGEYLGTDVSNGVVSSSGQNLPSGTVTIGWETVPYFYAGGETIYKTTHTTANI